MEILNPKILVLITDLHNKLYLVTILKLGKLTLKCANRKTTYETT